MRPVVRNPRVIDPHCHYPRLLKVKSGGTGLPVLAGTGVALEDILEHDHTTNSIRSFPWVLEVGTSYLSG